LRTQLGIDDENSIFDTVVWQMLRKPFEVFSKPLEFVFDTLHGGMRLMGSFLGGVLARLMEFVERRLILRSFDVFPLTGV
jgi:prolipoprotein diacylglyceryltransferase